MKKLLFTSSVMIIIMLNACNMTNEKKIEKDLSRRYPKFEISEINKDSANIEAAISTLKSLKASISQGNSDILKAENHYYGKSGFDKWSLERTEAYMDSVTSKLTAMCYDFMRLQFSRPDRCYHVRYRIKKGTIEEEKEDYYYFRLYSYSEKIELMHRSCKWADYLEEQNCINICDKCTEEYLKFLRSIMNSTN